MLRTLLCAAFLILLAACSAPPTPERRPEPQRPAGPLTYVSLGDSLAVGVGASDPRKLGYAPLLREHLERSTGREVRLVQLGVSGESSESFVGGYPDAESSQLARALATLEENPGAHVTLSLGGNDLLRTADLSDPEREAALQRYTDNLDYILDRLGAALDPAPRITVLALYNPIPGSFTDLWVGHLNERIRGTAAEHDARVAAGDRAFRGHEEEYAHHARYPWDIHPTDSGYRALARAFAEAENAEA